MKTKLTLQELFNLSSEIEGVSIRNEKGESQIIVKGIMNHKLSIVLKYRLHKLIDAINQEKKIFTDLRDNLDKDLTTEARAAEIQKLAEQEIELEYPDLVIEDFEKLETEEYYGTFFNKIIK